MKLKTVNIDHFKHVLDSTEVAIQPNITCLVGKNESGKTAFLEALRRLKPAQGAVDFSINRHYPAWLEKYTGDREKTLMQHAQSHARLNWRMMLRPLKTFSAIAS